MNKSLKKKKTKEQHIEDVLVELEKGISNFQVMIQKKDKTIQGYMRLLKLTKVEYQKLFHKNKTLKEKIEAIEKKRNIKKEEKIIKMQYKPEADSEEEQEEQSEASEEEDFASGDEPKTVVYKKIAKHKKKEKNKTKKKQNKKHFWVPQQELKHTYWRIGYAVSKYR